MDKLFIIINNYWNYKGKTVTLCHYFLWLRKFDVKKISIETTNYGIIITTYLIRYRFIKMVIIIEFIYFLISVLIKLWSFHHAQNCPLFGSMTIGVDKMIILNAYDIHKKIIILS